MLSSRVLSRAPTSARRLASLLSPSHNLSSSVLSRQFGTVPCESPYKYTLLLRDSNFNSYTQQRFGISSTASPRAAENGPKDAVGNNTADAEAPKANGDETSGQSEGVRPDGKVSDAAEKSSSDSGSRVTEPKQSIRRRRRVTKRVAFSDSDSEEEGELSVEKLTKLVARKEELLKLKDKEIEKMQDKFRTGYAEMENVMDRTKREAENSKKYAVQNFAKDLLDVADNLGRASSVVKDSFAKIDVSDDASGAVPLLKTLLEGVEMTEKQLIQAFEKVGIAKYDPTDEPFDPHRHNAVFQMPDSSKPPGTVAAVLEAGYMLHDRVLRPAEVGVTQAVENDSSGSNAARRGTTA